MDPYDLTVITGTWKRHGPLEQCLKQFCAQSTGGRLRMQHVVVSDGEDPVAQSLAARHGAEYYEIAHAGKWGTWAKDRGIELARGTYICFWDDDNIYYPHALATLYAAAYGVDVGIAQEVHGLDGDSCLIPRSWSGSFELGNIDTMCVCVRGALARRVRWSDAPDYATDYSWLSRLERLGISTRFVPVVIGVHP